MIKNVEMTLGTSVVLYDIISLFITGEATNEDGSITTFTRDLPTKLLYKLTRCKSILEKDKKLFEKERITYITKFGTPGEEGFEIADSKLPEFQEAISSLLETSVNHSVNMLTPEDFEELNLQVKVPLTEELMRVFILFLVEDASYIEDISKTLDIKIQTSKKKEEGIKEPPKKEVKKKPSKKKETIETSKERPKKKKQIKKKTP